MRKSFPKPLLDSVMSVFGMQPLRCRSCQYRFYKRLADEAAVALPSENEPGSRV